MHINRLKKQWNEEEEEEEQNRMKWLGNIERTRIESLRKEKCSVEVGGKRDHKVCGMKELKRN